MKKQYIYFINPDQQDTKHTIFDKVSDQRDAEIRRRRIADKIEKAMDILDGLDRRPRISLDRNGDGSTYYLLDYSFGTTDSQHRLYLGNLPEECVERFREYIEHHWPDPPDMQMDEDRIFSLETMAKLARSNMRTMAKGSGFYFHGHDMRKAHT